MNKADFLFNRLVWLILIFGVSCQKDSRKIDILLLKTDNVTIDRSTVDGVKFSASLILDSDEIIIEQGFVYGTESQPDIEKSVIQTAPLNGANSFSVTLEGALQPRTVYYMRSYVKSKNMLTYGNQVEFFSQGSPPPGSKND